MSYRYDAAAAVEDTVTNTTAFGSGSTVFGSYAPTQNPTFSPSPLETNPPKPYFNANRPALQAKIDAATAVADILLLTSAPTVFPTPHPTN